MNVLFVAPYAPSEVRVRPLHLILALRARGHGVTLAAPAAGAGARRDLERLADAGVEIVTEPLRAGRVALNCLTALVAGGSLQARICFAPRLGARLDHLVASGRFDVVHVEHLRGAAYARRLARDRDRTRPPLVWDSVDCISLLFEQTRRLSRAPRGRLMAAVDQRRTRREEAALLRLADRVLVTSEADASALRELAAPGPGAPIGVLPNGVDLERFRPPGAERGRAPATVILSGKMSYHANVSAAVSLVREIMPRVWAQRPEVEVRIAGIAPTRQVRGLAAAGAGRVTVTGAVAAMADELAGATVAVAPIWYGAGIQNKVLEAMACATPVVATPLSALALSAQPGRDLVVAPTPESLAAELLALLDDPARRETIGRAGRRYVERHHDWATIGSRLERMYAGARGADPRPL